LITLIAGFLVASAWASIGHGQLADPTKPPAALAAPAPDAAAAGAAVAGLQSVIMRKNGKPAALINGEVVELGDKLGEAKLVKITEDAVVLRGPQGEETLRLTPAAEKKVGADGTVKKRAPGTSRKEGVQ
jgi:MSHA biogenesis protein MshK